MSLATSNLSVNSIKTTLVVSSPKAIFRNADNSLKSTNQLWAIVNRWGLASYCPGSTSANKLSNLITYRKLSYFKGYDHNKNPMSATGISQFTSYGGTKSLTLSCVFSDYVWSLKSKPSWISSVSPSSGTGTNTISITAVPNSGSSRGDSIILQGNPKFYGDSNYEITIIVSQASGSV